MSVKALPDTNRAELFRKFSVGVGIAAIVGMADALRAMFWMALSAAAGESSAWTAYLSRGIRLAGWVLLAYVAWLVVARRVVPPTWAFLAIPIMIWASILASHVSG
jgi:predicted signal transduction protein with EAL and GGDEF domain